MSRMFDSYNMLELDSCDCGQVCYESNQQTDLYNIKGQQIGVTVAHEMPFTLYFHIDELQGFPITEFMQSCEVELKLKNRNHKDVLVKTFLGEAVYNAETGDIALDLSQEDALALKQESYGVEVRLVYPTGFYKIFSESDGLLVVR